MLSFNPISMVATWTMNRDLTSPILVIPQSYRITYSSNQMNIYEHQRKILDYLANFCECCLVYKILHLCKA